MAKKLDKNEVLAEEMKKEVDNIAIQLEQSLAECICTQFRLEFLAFKMLPRPKYEELCKKVADFSKKVCTSQQKVVPLQKNAEPHPADEVEKQ